MTAKAFHALDPLLHPIPDLLHEESEYLERLFTLLCSSVKPPLSLSIHGNWGSGKTSLMKSLQKQFEENNPSYPVFWFNPWEYERAEDIVFCFLGELSRFANNKLDIIKEELGIFGLTLAGVGADLISRLLTGNKMSYKQVSQIEKEVREALEGPYREENAVEIIKKDFAALTEKISQKHQGLPLIVFLDDLDRCLPDKALDLLDALKNLFVVPGAKVLFISGIDTGVAKQFITHRYAGLDPDFAPNYFKKIFHLTLNIPALTEKSFKKLLHHRLEQLLETPNLSWNFTPEQKSELEDFLSHILIQAGVKSIRQVYNVLHHCFILLQLKPHLRPQIKLYLILSVFLECWPNQMDQLEKRANQNPQQELVSVLEEMVNEEKNPFMSSLLDELRNLEDKVTCSGLLEF